MSTPLSNLNPRTYEAAIADVDGASAIAMDRCTAGVQAVAFATDGTDGLVNFTIDAQSDANIACWANAGIATGGVSVKAEAQSTTVIQVAVADAAGAAVNLAATAAKITLGFAPNAQLSKDV